ncbi:hypothetical protein [Serratia sp. (in: enterobacteria)]|uniref:hypothetical protein n=1 Tax=Serratia sp. (in: enterobacteria) TaxID=616 RepID=UPI003989DB87
MTDKHAILNVTAIINMLEEAKYVGYSDIEQTYFIINELIDILEKSDSVEEVLNQ